MTEQQGENVQANMAFSQLLIPLSLRKYQLFNLYNFDEEFYFAARRVLKPGMTAMEIGSYCGTLSALMGQMVGRRGKILLLDHAQDVLERAQTLALSNGLMNVRCLPVNINENENGIQTTDQLSLGSHLHELGQAPQLIKIETQTETLNVILGALGEIMCTQKPLLFLKLHTHSLSKAALAERLALDEYRVIASWTPFGVQSTQKISGNEPFLLICCHTSLQKETSEMLDGIQSWISRRQTHISRLTEARKLVNHKDFGAAFQIIREYLTVFPFDAEANYLAALCSVDSQLYLEDAFEYFRRALIAGFDEGWIRYQRGIAFRLAGKYTLAENDLIEAEKLGTGQEDIPALLEMVRREAFAARLSQARRLVEDGQYQEALLLLQDNLQFDKEDPDTHYYFAFCLQMSADQNEVALQHYNLALKKGYDPFWVYYNRASIYFDQQNYAEAMHDLLLARELHPENLNIVEKVNKVKVKISQKPASKVNQQRLYVPHVFENLVPVSPCALGFDYEPVTMLALQAVVKNDSIVFDVGASYGVLSASLAARSDFSGKVFAFEANKEVLRKAQFLAALNSLDDSIEFLPFCVGEASQKNVSFYTIEGYASVASTRNPHIQEEFAEVERVDVDMIDLDSFCKEISIEPRVIKIDVEGSEYLVLQGAAQLIQEKRPALIIETHWERIREIGGSLQELCAFLTDYGYRFYDLQNDGRAIAAEEYRKKYESSIGYLLAVTSLDGFASDEDFAVWMRSEMEQVKQRQADWKYLDKARELLHSGQYNEALSPLIHFIEKAGNYAEGHYLMAYCLHKGDIDTTRALAYYRQAQEYGYSPFWVYYHRGSLYQELGAFKNALDDLQRAFELQPENLELQTLYLNVRQQYALEQMEKARELVDGGKFEEAISVLEFCLNEKSSSAAAHYYTAYCLQQMGEQDRQALVHYQEALQKGYDRFWIHYHRALLLSRQQDFSAAFGEIKLAEALNPHHPGVIKTRRELENRLGKL